MLCDWGSFITLFATRFSTIEKTKDQKHLKICFYFSKEPSYMFRWDLRSSKFHFSIGRKTWNLQIKVSGRGKKVNTLDDDVCNMNLLDDFRQHLSVLHYLCRNLDRIPEKFERVPSDGLLSKSRLCILEYSQFWADRHFRWEFSSRCFRQQRTVSKALTWNFGDSLDIVES